MRHQAGLVHGSTLQHVTGKIAIGPGHPPETHEVRMAIIDLHRREDAKELAPEAASVNCDNAPETPPPKPPVAGAT